MRISRTIGFFGFLALLAYLGVSSQDLRLLAQAQQAPNAPQAQTPAPQGQISARPSVPSDAKIIMLIFSSVIALNQANATGNYSVLRDIGSPGFQANSVDRIAEAFADLRQRNLDLSPALIFQPKLLHNPEIDAGGMLRVTGFFPTQPERVNFDLLFEPIQGQWKLFGIHVDTSQAPAPAAATVGKPAPVQAGNPAPAAPPGSAPAAAATPDVRDRVNQIETRPPPRTKPKPTESSSFPSAN